MTEPVANSTPEPLICIRGLRTVYYMAKVMLAILIGALRRRATPLEDG